MSGYDRRESDRLYDLYKRDPKARAFYRSAAWATVRAQALHRDHYECQECQRQGRVSKGQNVHHIKELRDYPELALELENLETLCIRCHNDTHNRTFGSNEPNRWEHDEMW